MVFPSIPAYLDPANWQQQATASDVSSGNTQLFLPQQQEARAPAPPAHGGGSTGSIRPGSMAERARMANIPIPEAALKCPRCESTNTKFCYFNNYNLSQPRHFCKTCRRYWTRGGALRNVPVGGGCRKNRRTKASTSNTTKAPPDGTSTSNDNSNNNTSNAGPTSSLGSIISSYKTGLIPGNDQTLGLGSSLPPLRLMAPNLHHIHQLNDQFTNPGENLGGLSYGAFSTPMSHHEATGSQTSGGVGGGGASLLSGLEHWRFPAMQLPLLSGLDISSSSSSAGFHPFQQAGMEQSVYGNLGSGRIRPSVMHSSASGLSYVKIENNPDLNMSRQFLGNDQLWGANTAGTSTSSWSDVSNFCSSSPSNAP